MEGPAAAINPPEPPGDAPGRDRYADRCCRHQSAPPVARALEVLLVAPTNLGNSAGAALIRAANSKSLSSAVGGLTSRAPSSHDVPRRTEFNELRQRARSVEITEPHMPGTTENRGVFEDNVEFELAGVAYRLDDGDAILFEADGPRAYRKVGRGEARSFLAMTYGEVIG